MLSSEVWTLIGLHLKPRHLIKLAATCKQVQKAVDNEIYWTRVYTHLLWRRCEELEIQAVEDSDRNTLPCIEYGLFHMYAVEKGYYWGMQRFFQRMEEAIEYYSENDSDYTFDDESEWWASLKHMSMAERNKALVRKEKRIKHEYTTMKGLARIEMIENMDMKTIDSQKTEAEQKHFSRFACEIEDDPIPIKYKRVLMRKISRLFWHRLETEDVMSPLRATEAIMMINYF
jgi:hypothetical protein